MDKCEMYSARYAAHRDVAELIMSHLGARRTTFTYFSNQYVSDSEKEKYRRHLEALAMRHYLAMDKYMSKLMKISVPQTEV